MSQAQKITTLQHLRNQLDTKEVSSVELTQEYIARIQSSGLNAFISLNEQLALTHAHQADSRIAQGESSPLLGIPIAHKDIFCIQDTQTSCGSKMLEGFKAPYTATVVEQLNHAGSVPLGKTNMDEFAMGSSNEHSYFGPALNPWGTPQRTLVPGGSSGGSASAVAGNLAPAATGTDTGGSIRQPAAFCNLTGLKPSYGRCSRYGMVAFASSLDQAGPLTKTAYDAALMFDAMSGFDPKDSTSVQGEIATTTEHLGDAIKGLRIGLPREYFSETLNSDTQQALDETIRTYESLGATCVDVSLPHSKQALASYYVIAPAEASSNLSRFDGVRYGFRADDYEDLASLYRKTRSQGFGDEVKRRILLGTYVLSSGYYDAYYAKAQRVRRLVANDFAAAFEQCDVLLGPTAPSGAFSLNEQLDDPVTMYLNDIYTIPVNLAGLPAVSIPMGFDQDQRPLGQQLIGPYWGEAKLLQTAHQFQCATDWHLREPSHTWRNA